MEFQSAPSITAGGFLLFLLILFLQLGFNPPPALLLGDSDLRKNDECGLEVSIRPQHYCWGIPAFNAADAAACASFNPPPALLLGDSRKSNSCKASDTAFQSAPSITAGGFLFYSLPKKEGISFNPPPALLLGDSYSPQCRSAQSSVSIRPQHYCWGILNLPRSPPEGRTFQSAPSITAGGFAASGTIRHRC